MSGLTSSELERVRATGVRWLAQVDLAPGHHQLRVAARALATGTSGTTTLDVDVPSFEPDDLAMSGVTLTSLPSVLMFTRGDDWLQPALGTPPSAARASSLATRSRRLSKSTCPHSGRPTSTSRRRSSVRMARAWRLGAGRWRAATARPRAEAIAFPVDTAQLQPGRYVLHVVLDPSGGATTIERRVQFEVLRKD